MNIVYMPLPIKRHNLSIFAIGTNQPLINNGALLHYASEGFGLDVEKLCSRKVDGLAISGYLLDIASVEAPEAIEKLCSYVYDNNVTLYAVPYYETSFSVMDQEECKEQLSMEKDSLVKHLGKSFSGVYTGDQFVPNTVKEVFSELGVRVLDGKSDYHHVALLDEEFREVKESGEFSSFLPVVEADHELCAHVQEELVNIYPHVLEFGDQSTLLNWRLLSQGIALQGLDPDTNTEAYDEYVANMNALNDLAHQLRSVQYASRGEFLHDVDVVDNPSKLLQGE